MSTRLRHSLVLTLGVAALTLAACSGGAHDEAATDQAAATDHGASAEASEESPASIDVVVSDANLEAVHALLATADAMDGTEDGVVTKCPGCALMMDGNADYAMTVADHELHFCSDSCRDRFSENAEASLVALEVPAH